MGEASANGRQPVAAPELHRKIALVVGRPVRAGGAGGVFSDSPPNEASKQNKNKIWDAKSQNYLI